MKTSESRLDCLARVRSESAGLNIHMHRMWSFVESFGEASCMRTGQRSGGCEPCMDGKSKSDEGSK